MFFIAEVVDRYITMRYALIIIMQNYFLIAVCHNCVDLIF